MASAGKNDPREGQCEYGTMKGAITNTNHWAKIGQGDVKGISIVEEPQSKNGDKCKQNGQGPTDGNYELHSSKIFHHYPISFDDHSDQYQTDLV